MLSDADFMHGIFTSTDTPEDLIHKFFFLTVHVSEIEMNAEHFIQVQ